MKVSRRQIQQIALFAAIVVVFSSCNRGYGCPMSDFSLTDTLVDAVVNTVKYLF